MPLDQSVGWKYRGCTDRRNPWVSASWPDDARNRPLFTVPALYRARAGKVRSSLRRLGLSSASFENRKVEILGFTCAYGSGQVHGQSVLRRAQIRRRGESLMLLGASPASERLRALPRMPSQHLESLIYKTVVNLLPPERRGNHVF